MSQSRSRAWLRRVAGFSCDGGLRLAPSKIALAFAVTVVACGQGSPVAPPSSSSFSAKGTPLRAPPDVRAAFVGTGSRVVISWDYGSGLYNSTGMAGYLVQRAPDPAGPWGIHGFTQETKIGDILSAGQRYCYRVIAVSSSSSRLDSPPSLALCIAASAPGS